MEIKSNAVGARWVDFELRDGLGLLHIGLAEAGSYLAFREPRAVVWHDNCGSVGKFLAIMPYSPEYREQLRDNILASLYEDFSDRPDEACRLIAPLLRLLGNGTYTVSFSSAATPLFFARWRPGESAMQYSRWSLEIDTATDKANETELMREKYAVRPLRYDWELLERTTYSFYDAFYSALVATQPAEQIDEGRVAFFEQEIREGRRPFAIVLSQWCHVGAGEEWDSACYVLDGHHKLLAYARAGIYPPILSIASSLADPELLRFDTEALQQHLLEWQYQDLMEL